MRVCAYACACVGEKMIFDKRKGNECMYVYFKNDLTETHKKRKRNRNLKEKKIRKDSIRTGQERGQEPERLTGRAAARRKREKPGKRTMDAGTKGREKRYTR